MWAISVTCNYSCWFKCIYTTKNQVKNSSSGHVKVTYLRWSGNYIIKYSCYCWENGAVCACCGTFWLIWCETVSLKKNKRTSTSERNKIDFRFNEITDQFRFTTIFCTTRSRLSQQLLSQNTAGNIVTLTCSYKDAVIFYLWYTFNVNALHFKHMISNDEEKLHLGI